MKTKKTAGMKLILALFTAIALASCSSPVQTNIPVPAELGSKENLSFSIAFFNENQVPGGYSAATQTPKNIIENTGIINSDANLQVPSLINTAPTTNYAGAAVTLAAKLLLQPTYSMPAGVSTFNSMYASLGIISPALASPVSFANFHAAMRRIHDNASTTGILPALKFGFNGSGSGLDIALNQAGFTNQQTVLTKYTVASNQNTTAITTWLGQSKNITALGTKRAIVVECSRDAKGIVSFSSNQPNHTILVKYEIIGGVNTLYMYDPGMPNSPGTPSATPNYRPMKPLEILALNASINKLVGIGYITPPPNVILVDVNATGANDGTNWADAYTSLQSALAASSSGVKNEIWVAKGTYKPGALQTNFFLLKTGVSVYGGFAAVESQRSQRVLSPANETILSGDLNNSGTADVGDCYHVVTGVIGATLDGVTIKNGFTHGGGTNDLGVGMYNPGTTMAPINNTLSINNVIFDTNSAANGGGMYNTSSSPALSNIKFTSNSATVDGGGIYNNANSSPKMTDVTFFNNHADNGSGGAMLNDASSPTITSTTGGNTFDSNHAYFGGGIYNNGAGSLPVITNLTFYNNSAAGGGGMSNSNSKPTIKNVTFNNNIATILGGGMYNNASSPTLDKVTFSSNQANGTDPSDGGGGMYNYIGSSTTIINSIFWGNTAISGVSIYNQNASTLNITYSDVDGGLGEITGGVGVGGTYGVNNITSDPLFSNPLNINGPDGIPRTADDGLSLKPGSPAIDSGTNAATPADKDITGVSRPRGAKFDMGAYEK